ncbi:hypothetical protein [Paraburkholderia guartelaensis]|uniref:hypothetical protein n=1 Tax=Paraburkholderia guartelaensis TaxID=2546446 RepID=UPI00140D669C|nr:hypothetical protein [Paraburkholderia guartelaensis]
MPETLVKRGDVAVSQREVAFDIVPIAWMIAAGVSTFASEGQVWPHWVLTRSLFRIGRVIDYFGIHIVSTGFGALNAVRDGRLTWGRAGMLTRTLEGA